MALECPDRFAHASFARSDRRDRVRSASAAGLCVGVGWQVFGVGWQVFRM